MSRDRLNKILYSLLLLIGLWGTYTISSEVNICWVIADVISWVMIASVPWVLPYVRNYEQSKARKHL